jgi:uncharacterized membrane protein
MMSVCVNANSLSTRCTRWYIAALCLLGAIRVFVGAAGLPLFNDVDEQAHFDLVYRLARASWPNHAEENWSEETARVQAFYGSWEFVNAPERFPNGVYPPPLWALPQSANRDALLGRLTARFRCFVNHEAHSPPIYYLMAAGWYNLGKFAGLGGAHAVYWVRFLNIPLHVVLIVAAYGFCRAYFSSAVAHAVAAMVAFFPSTVFFSISSDVLAPLMMLLALWLLLRWLAGPANARLSIAAGLAVAATLLVKLTNVAVLAACGVAAMARSYRAWKAGQLTREWPKVVLLLFSAIGPCALWMMCNQLLLGDWTGTKAKLHCLGWQARPLGQFLDHPMFSLAGQTAFWSRLFTSFYFGDMSWHGRAAMGFFPSEVFFLLSFLFVPVGLGAFWTRRLRPAETRTRAAAMLCALTIVASILLLITLSLTFDFGRCACPSRRYPYLNSGRLLYGSLIPVLALYACGAVTVSGRARLATTVVLGMSVLLMALPQAILWRQVLKSQYNWFHIVMGRPHLPVAFCPPPAPPDGNRPLAGTPASSTVPSAGYSAARMPRPIHTRGPYKEGELLRPLIGSSLSCHAEVRWGVGTSSVPGRPRGAAFGPPGSAPAVFAADNKTVSPGRAELAAVYCPLRRRHDQMHAWHGWSEGWYLLPEKNTARLTSQRSSGPSRAHEWRTCR